MVRRLSFGLGAAVLCAAAGLAAWYFLGGMYGPSGGTQPPNPPISGAMAKFTPSVPLRPAPVAQFQDAEGNSVSLLDFSGKVVLLNIWATWCAPCVEEMPALDRLQARLGGEGLVVVPLSIDLQGAEAVRPFYEKNGITRLGIYVDMTNSFSQVIGVDAVPANLLISRNGLFLGKLVGNADWDSPEATALLRYYLNAEVRQ
jgi:thiol-disulfide isomerase/thioredoxin